MGKGSNISPICLLESRRGFGGGKASDGGVARSNQPPNIISLTDCLFMRACVRACVRAYENYSVKLTLISTLQMIPNNCSCLVSLCVYFGVHLCVFLSVYPRVLGVRASEIIVCKSSLSCIHYDMLPRLCKCVIYF